MARGEVFDPREVSVFPTSTAVSEDALSNIPVELSGSNK
jgi:hypothetical protein